MLIMKRKFDIRIWVLITNLNPLTIWFWEKPYIRFAGADYLSGKFKKNLFVHLTNNSIAKGAKQHEIIGDGNMWTSE